MTAINRIEATDLDAFVADPSLTNYQQIATKSAFYPGQGTPLGLAYCGLKVNGEAGELAEHIGKAMRDDKLMDYSPDIQGNGFVCRPLEGARKVAIIKEVGDVLWYLSAICNELGITLEAAAGSNLTKLWDRGCRDALQGSGDDR